MRAITTLLLLNACDEGKGPTEEGLERVDLGVFTTDDEGSVPVPFDVPSGAFSTLVYCGPYGWDALATAETITAPDDSVAYDYEDETGTPMRVGVHADVLPVLIPVSPDLPLMVGAWSMGLYVQADTYPVSVSCNAVHRTQELSDPTMVDLHIVLVGVDDVIPDLDEIGSVDVLAPVLDIVKELWSPAGIEVGEVTYENFDGDVATYESVDGDEELGNLLRTVNTPGERRITFFFVESITDTDGAPILGLAGGPPGTAAVGGTSKSGVVVTAADVLDDPDTTARIMAHEGGHFVGLFHTTEKDGAKSDPISDTPECDISADGDGSGTLSSSECEGTGAENLMWWSASQDSRDLTEDQAWVMVRSAAVY